MSDRTSIALACPAPGESNSVATWLSQAGYDAVAIRDLSRLDEDLQVHAIEALIADMALVPREDDVRGLVRRLGSNRPLVVVGDPKRLPGAVRDELCVIDRPLTREALLLSVGLALAEGRPARKFPRRQVQPIPAKANGIAVTVREASTGGVGLELSGPRQGVLPPFFDLRIPSFGVHVVVKRAWMASTGPDSMRCGGTVEGDLADASRAWSEFVREAPVPVSSVARRWTMR